MIGSIMIKYYSFSLIPMLVSMMAISTYFTQIVQASDENRMNRGSQMTEKMGSRMGNRQGIAIACEKLVNSLDKRLERLSQAGDKRAQFMANLEKSVENRVEALKLQNKNTDTITSNFASFEQKYNEYYNERGLLVTKLRSLKDKGCSDSDIEGKKSFVKEIKDFNVEYRSHLKEFKDLSSYLRQNVLEEIRKLRGNE